MGLKSGSYGRELSPRLPLFYGAIIINTSISQANHHHKLLETLLTPPFNYSGITTITILIIKKLDIAKV